MPIIQKEKILIQTNLVKLEPTGIISLNIPQIFLIPQEKVAAI